jgi:hypothetical protein
LAARRARRVPVTGPSRFMTGSACRTNDGSTTTASAPVSASRAVRRPDPERIGPQSSGNPPSLEGAVDQLPDGVRTARAEDVVAIARADVRLGRRPGDNRPARRSGGDPDDAVDVVGGEAPLAAHGEVADPERARHARHRRRRHAASGRSRRPWPSGRWAGRLLDSWFERMPARNARGRTHVDRHHTGRGRPAFAAA